MIKCFCGICETWFKRKSIEYAIKANAEEILRDEESKIILKKFLIYRKGDLLKDEFRLPSQAERTIECFELSQDIQNGVKDLKECQEKLEDLCFTVNLKTELTMCINKNSSNKDILGKLIVESAKILDTDQEFLMFKDELKKKLKI